MSILTIVEIILVLTVLGLFAWTFKRMLGTRCICLQLKFLSIKQHSQFKTTSQYHKAKQNGGIVMKILNFLNTSFFL